MKKLICPQCSIANFYVKNSDSDVLPVYVTSSYQVVPTKEDRSLDGFDIDTIYCLGCSWSGSPEDLKK